MNKEIKVGDVVVHKVTRQQMGVVSIKGEKVHCTWMSKGERCEGDFFKVDLELHSEEL